MNKWLWYSLVLIAIGLLLLSMLTGKLILSVMTLLLALFLKRYYHSIPLPKYLTTNKIHSSISGKIYDSSAIQEGDEKR